MNPKICINVMSFNRPHYLRQVLLSLRENTQYDICLIQDGAVNRFSGNRYAKDTEIQSCVDTFTEIFPNGEVDLSLDNVGVALQYHRAELRSFTNTSYDAAIFIEDDFLVGRDYIRILTEIYKRTLPRLEIGTVSAYGPDRFVSLDEQAREEFRLESAIPNWGFLVSKERWEETHPFLTDYLEMVSGSDYRERPNHKIGVWMRGKGFSGTSTSQDTAHAIACFCAGQVRLMTRTRNAHYIGAEGLHFTRQQFDDGYYGKDQIWKYESFGFKIPTSEKLLQMLAETAASKFV